jgi:hypothetical protein
VRRHFVTYWLVWPLLAALAVASNQVVDQVVWDERRAVDNDILVAICVVATAFFGSYFVAGKQGRMIR